MCVCVDGMIRKRVVNLYSSLTRAKYITKKHIQSCINLVIKRNNTWIIQSNLHDSPSCASLVQPHQNWIRGATRQSQVIPHFIPLQTVILNVVESLQQPHKDIAGFGEGELLPDADTWPAVERDIVPSRLSADPPFRLEFFCIVAPEVFPSVHDVYVISNSAALGDEDGQGSIGPTATGDGGVAHGDATVDGDDWVKTEYFIEGVLEILAGFESRKGDRFGLGVGAEGVENDLAEFVEDLWVVSEEEHGPTKKGGSRVTTSQEDVEELGA